MDIVVKNQLTEEKSIFKQIDSQLAAILIAAGIASPYVKSAEVSSGPTYFIGTPPSGFKKCIVRRKGSSTDYICGPRAQIGKQYPDCPAQVIDDFESLPAADRMEPLQTNPAGIINAAKVGVKV